MKYFRKKYFLLLMVALVPGCFTVKYDFKGGAQIDPKINTVSVQYINNRALTVNPALSQSLTDKLKAYMENNTNLRVVNSIGDVDFSGEITTYSLSTSTISSGDRQSQIRFTITVRIKFTNSVNSDDSFDTSFSKYLDFDSNTNFNTIEDSYVEEMVDDLIEQIFNKAFVNW